MKYADIIVPHGRSNTIAIDFIVSNLKNKVPIESLNHLTPMYKSKSNVLSPGMRKI